MPCALCKKNGLKCSGGMPPDKRRSMAVDQTEKDKLRLITLIGRYGEEDFAKLCKGAMEEHRQNKSSVNECSPYPERTS